MDDMDKHFDNFDKHFRRMQKTAGFEIVASAVVSLAVIALAELRHTQMYGDDNAR